MAYGVLMRNIVAIAALATLALAAPASADAPLLEDRVVSMDTRLITAETQVTEMTVQIDDLETRLAEAEGNLDAAADEAHAARSWINRCMTVAEGVRIKMVDGERVIVDVKDSHATRFVAFVDRRCIVH